jgi:hypothetical protein
MVEKLRSPITVTFDTPVTNRAAVQHALTVTTSRSTKMARSPSWTGPFFDSTRPLMTFREHVPLIGVANCTARQAP